MLRKLQVSEFDAFFALLEVSFPADEYRTYAAQKAIFDDPRYSVYVLSDAPAQIKAAITVWQFADFAFIEHFAVDPAYRNQGLGALILGEIKNFVSCALCLEAELPKTEIARRRIGFYERNGFFTNAYPYIQPAYSAEKNPVPLLILTTGGGISETQFATIRETLYSEVYKQSQEKKDETAV